MESIETFVNIFQRSWQEKNHPTLTSLLKDIPNYLKNTSRSDTDRILELLLGGQNGLFKCIKSVLDAPKGWSGSNIFLRESFEALQSIMDFAEQRYEPYIMGTRNLCFYCVKTQCWYYARKTAAETFKKLINLHAHYDMQLDEIVEYYSKCYERHYSSKEGSIFYIILGAIGKYCPKLESINQYINTIFTQLLKNLSHQYKPKESRQPEEIKIYLECYSDLFKNFLPLEDEDLNSSSYLTDLYNIIMKICEPDKAQKIYRSKAIYFLSYNMKHFSSLIFNDYEKWHKLFNNILDDVESYTILSALKNFYNIVALHLTKTNNDNVFWFFRNHFMLNLCYENTSPRKLQLIISGLGEFSIAYSKYSPQESHEVFQMIALRALYRTDKLADDLEILATSLETLSQIVRHTKNITPHQVSILVEISVRFIKSFPEMKKSSQNLAMNALKTTFVNASYLSMDLYYEYLNSVFREGVLWSCSHTLYVDVQLQCDFENSPSSQICYKDYLPFWLSLFKSDDQEKFSTKLAMQMFDEFVSVLMAYITKLNFNVKAQDDECFSNALLSLTAENETDYWFFINLVDLYVDIFENVNSILLQNSMEKLAIFLVNFSYKYPLISGFYKLMKVVLKNSDSIADYERFFSKSVQELFIHYLSDILKLVSGFSEELQNSCIDLIFSASSFLIKGLIDEMLPVFKIAFNVGLSNLPLAFSALKTLESWSKNPDIQFSDNFLKNILRYMEPYLSTNEISSKSIQSNVKLEKYEQKRTDDSDGSLADLQNKILLFHGSLNSTILFDFIHEKTTNTNATWNKKNLLQYELLFPDIRLEMHLDKFLSRVIDLSNSGDPKIKVSACELFHSIITIILGKNLMEQIFNKNLCNTLLRLGCDPDDAIKNLFHPLAIQLTHYLSSNLMKDSRIAQDFIDSLFEGLAEEFNTPMRDHCGLYLKEFAQWSIKQSADQDLTKDPNITSKIVRKITILAVYPSNKKRLAAVLAFNNLYTILRENLSIVQTYWLQFLHAFINCLEEYDNLHVVAAIDHVVRVLEHYKIMFNAKNRNRRKPYEFYDETLRGVVIWLFEHCNSVNTKCRNKCMELFQNLFPLVINRDAIVVDLENKAQQIGSKHLTQKLDFGIFSLSNGQIFLKFLDFYIWISKHKFISTKYLLKIDDTSNNTNIFANYFSKFVKLVINQDDANLRLTHASKFIGAEELINLRNDIILKIFEFVSAILDAQEDHAMITWNNDLHLLIVRCIVNPQELGLSVKKLQQSENFYSSLAHFLSSMKDRAHDTVMRDNQRVFLLEANEYFLHFDKIDVIVNLKDDMKERIHTLKLFVKGLYVIKKCQFHNFENAKNLTTSYWLEKVNDIFRSLKVKIMDNHVCKQLNDHVKEYLNELMYLCLVTAEADNSLTIIALIRLILSDDPLDTSNGIKISHGEYFLKIFKEPIFRCMMKGPLETINLLDQSLLENPDKVLLIIEKLLKFSQLHFSNTIESDILSKQVLLRCEKLNRAVNNIDDRDTKFFNINSIAIKLMKIPSEITINTDLYKDFHLWLSTEVFGGKSIERKTLALQNFLICMGNEKTNDIGSYRVESLFKLRPNNDVEWLSDLKKKEYERLQAINLFNVLLKNLPITKSIMVYESGLRYALGACKILHKESLRLYFDPYFTKISNKHALASLDLCFGIFMNMSESEQRFDVLQHYLLASLESNKADVIKKFYENHNKDLIAYIMQTIDTSDRSVARDRKQLIATKTGCYSIFELLFARFDLHFSHVRDKVSGKEKTLSSFLVEEGLKLRLYSAANEDEKELTRQLHCAALNCCISIVSLKKEEKFYKFIFMEDRTKNQLLWERIIDCSKVYNLLPQSSSSIRKERRRLINIRGEKQKSQLASQEFAVSYIYRRDLSQLSFAENIHAYDLNDARVSSQVCKKPDDDRRFDLSFENDEFNDHECMPMISGMLIHMINNGVSSLPDANDPNLELPLFLKHFRNGLATDKLNVILYMFKIICNTKEVFMPYFKLMFLPIATALNYYLANKPLNYIVRDVLVMIIESKYELPTLKEVPETEIAQKLLKVLINRVGDTQTSVYKYNLQILESLFTLWSSSPLTWPENLDDLIQTCTDVGFSVLYILLRTGICNARNVLMRKESLKEIIVNTALASPDSFAPIINVSMLERSFELLGMLLKLSNDQELEEEMFPRILTTLGLMHNSQDRGARLACALYAGWQSQSDTCEQLLTSFACPRTLPVSSSEKSRCLELYLSRLSHRENESEKLAAELESYIGLTKILADRQLSCLSTALRILQRLVCLLPEPILRPYLDLLAKGYCSPALCILEHRLLVYRILGEAYARHPNSPVLGLWFAQLVQGLEDPDDEVQDLLLDFWRTRLQLPDTCCERLLGLLAMYAPDLKDGFSRLLCLMMLELTSKSPDVDRSMFRPLIEQCSFKEWNPTIVGNWRRRQQLCSMVPLFAPSLFQATQRLQDRMLASGSCNPAEIGNSALGSMRIRATGELIFEPTAPFAGVSQAGRSQIRIPDPSQNRLSKRLTIDFIPLPTWNSSGYGKTVERQKNYHDQLREEKEKRQNTTKLYRKYRIGDFPDVELSHSSFILSLRQLMIRDWFFCKDLTVALVCSIMNRFSGNTKYANLLEIISLTFEKVLHGEDEKNNFAPAALEIAQHAGAIMLKSSAVRRICKNMKLNALGIVILEEENIRKESILDCEEQGDEPPSKRMRRISVENNKIELVSLYKSLGISDMATSILRDETFSDSLKHGALAESVGDWQAASKFYEIAHKFSFDLEQDHCLDSLFECMRELSNWGEINKKIEIILNEDYSAIWKHRQKNQLLPWIFEAQLHKALEDYVSNKDLDPKNDAFIQNINEWIRMGDQLEIQSNFGQELSLILLCSTEKSEELAQHYLKLNLDRVREQWIRLSPLAENARLEILKKLRGIYNIDAYIRTIKSEDVEEATKNLIQYWNCHLPFANEDLSSWNMHVTYRLAFAKLLHEKLQNYSEDRSLSNNLLLVSVKQRIKISELAMKNKNNFIAKKHSSRIEKLMFDLTSDTEEMTEDNDFIKLQQNFFLIASKYKLVCGESEQNAKKKCNYYVSSWKIANDILDNENTDLSIQIKTKYHMFDLISSLQKSVSDDYDDFMNISMTNDFILSNIETMSGETVFEKLEKYKFTSLQSTSRIGSTKEMAKSNTKFGKYCYSLLYTDNESDSTLIKEFIRSILTGMSLGSLESAHYFPCLLKPEYYLNNTEAEQLFISMSADVPTWLFLFWQAQIISYLGKLLAQLLIPIIRRLVNEYPNGIIYNFRQTYLSLSHNWQINADIRSMYQSLYSDSRIEQFIDAMHHVCQPENYLTYHLSRLKNSKENIVPAIDFLLDKIYGKQDEKNIQGWLFKKTINHYRDEIEKLKNLDPEAAKSSIDILSRELYDSMKQRLADSKYQNLQLANYSQHLSHFSDKDMEIEIPGQYDKRLKPLPRYHVKISKFDRFVKVMDSKCNPIRISMIGNDAKSYGFLVKFGEDLRQDQRLQQIFNIVNETLNTDKNCNRRYLSINTYHVVPLSISLGLIEWVDETRSLKEFVEFTMKDKKIVNIVLNKYQNWIDKAATSGKNTYKEALLKYDRKEVVSKMQEFIKHFEWDCLRKTFTVLSPNVECFVSLRHNFITSYATMCIVHWIAGVGDRHLENMLIEVKSGKCYGIDFGAAFGAGIDQEIPELVPFRLTSQILGLFKPFDEKALFGTTMTHVLKALRNERHPILASFDVFIHEPLNWSKNRNQKSKNDNDNPLDIKWSAEKKIQIVKNKLNGVKPSNIMIEELSNMHRNSSADEYFLKYKNIMNDIDLDFTSVTPASNLLSPETQIQYLLKQAKDLNLLGRMYAGWTPFL